MPFRKTLASYYGNRMITPGQRDSSFPLAKQRSLRNHVLHPYLLSGRHLQYALRLQRHVLNSYFLLDLLVSGP